jgi:hypothetical protein
MTMKHLAIVFTLFCLMAGLASAQPTPGISAPFNLDLGIGGGISSPMGTFSNYESSGWHAGAKARLHGFMPLNVVASLNYHRYPEVLGGSDFIWMGGAGLEYTIPSPVVKPYFGVDGLINMFNNTGAGAQSSTREGVGLGGGIEFAVPTFGSFDASVKYQMLNLFGKNGNEDTISQVAANISVMFSIL